MKVITKELAETYKDEAVRELNCFYESMSEEDISGDYFKWIALKTRIISGEKHFSIPYDAVPTIINDAEFNYLYDDKQKIVLKYYKHEPENRRYVLNVKKTNIEENDKDVLVHTLVLKRGAVVWLEFGYNIGAEFGGKHPALILRNYRESLIVLPLSSKMPSEAAEKFSVQIEKVYNFPLKQRWTNVLRIQPVSIQRIDFRSRVGSVNSRVMEAISQKIKEQGIR